MDQIMEQFATTVSVIGATLGSNVEVVLFDMKDKEISVFTSANLKNGSIARLQFLVKNILSREEQTDTVVNLPVSGDYGKLFKVSVQLIRNNKGKIVGALCICMNCDSLLKLNAAINDLMEFNSGDSSVPAEIMAEVEPTIDGLKSYIREFNIENGRASYNEKMEIICDLYDMGMFNLKGAVAAVAEELKISSKSVYRYITKIKSVREK